MKNTFGQSVCVTLFGESHGPAVGIVADGLAPGLDVDEKEIAYQLTRRRPDGETETARQEADPYRILSGVFEGKTTGTPLCIVIPNEDTKSGDYERGLGRPSHADFTGHVKYRGYEDYRGGGHFSGRVTAALTALGGILIPALEKKGITIGTHILKCGDIRDSFYRNPEKEILLLKDRNFPVLDEEKGLEMREVIRHAGEEQDSVGGITQTAVCGIEAGVGEPWFDSVEGMLSHALYSLGGIKGVEFGLGFSFAHYHGSECNDPLMMLDGRIVTETNNNGGINGGITNGMPILFQCAVKPTPSIGIPQYSVDLNQMEDRKIQILGRHDPAIIRRICPVIDSVTAIVLSDLLAQRHGTDWLGAAELRKD